MNYAKLKTKLPELLDALRGVIYPEVFGPSDGGSVAAAELRARALLAELLPEVQSIPCRAGATDLPPSGREAASEAKPRMTEGEKSSSSIGNAASNTGFFSPSVSDGKAALDSSLPEGAEAERLQKEGDSSGCALGMTDSNVLQSAGDSSSAVPPRNDSAGETPRGDGKAVTDALMARMPAVRELLETDLVAAYEGDPAATCREEIITAYPAFEAMSVFRVAHELYVLGVPMLPRMMTEYAHSRTGIDIHPGATIGRYFFIDHGTGVVIGETTVIGDRVKLYHGVTLGAKSFDVAPDGSLVKGVKRHPNIGSGVVIYAGATILGGDTTIGDGCVIGGNVWLTHSVPAGRTVVAAHERVAEKEHDEESNGSVKVFL